MCCAQIWGQASEKRACVSFRITSIFLAHKRPSIIRVWMHVPVFATYKHTDKPEIFLLKFNYKHTIKKYLMTELHWHLKMSYVYNLRRDLETANINHYKSLEYFLKIIANNLKTIILLNINDVLAKFFFSCSIYCHRVSTYLERHTNCHMHKSLGTPTMLIDATSLQSRHSKINYSWSQGRKEQGLNN